jgi:integrase
LALYATEHVASDKVASKATATYSIDTLLRWWGGRTCDYVTPETCEAYVRDRVAAGWKDSTAARELTVLRAALTRAHKRGKMVDLPAVELPSRPPGRDRWLTRSEAARLLWEARRDPQARDHLTHFILLGLATGARSGALFDLQWSQVDFIGNTINFNPPGRRQTAKNRPIIAIPRRLRWFLLAAHARASSAHVLTFNGKQIKSVKKSFRAARDRAGLGPEVVPYTMRHTAGTWLAQAGVDLWTIAGWLGHSQQKTTALYAHHHPSYQEAARRVMD